MNKPLSRRRFLQIGAGLAALPAAGLAAPAAGEAKLTAYQDGPQIWVRLGGRLLTSYRAHPTQKYPYLYPVNGPLSGLSLTAESGLPWPHHRSLFFGCDHLNGANFWQGPTNLGQIVSTGLKLGEITAASAQILDSCEWRVPGQPAVLSDQRRLTITVVSPQQWHVDADIRLTALQAVQVTKTNHSLFAVRAAEDVTPLGGGQLVNAEGHVGEKATFGQAAAWCDFSGRRRGSHVKTVEGIALLDHPKNPWSPCKWFTRDYGFMSPSPFNWLDAAGWRLPAEQSISLRYRVVLHAGDAKDADLAGAFKRYAASQ